MRKGIEEALLIRGNPYAVSKHEKCSASLVIKGAQDNNKVPLERQKLLILTIPCVVESMEKWEHGFGNIN